MNERIKELIEESRDLVPTQTKVSDGMYIPGPIVRGDVNLQRFAKLIVKECALQCLADYDMDRILEHFGVEE